jgi:AhpD family alkylhydroperoxidase
MIKTPLVPIPSFEDLSPTFQELSRQGRARLGVQVNSVHAFAHAEELGAATRRFLTDAMTLGSLSRELRLLIRLAVSNTNQCRYCCAHQIHQLHGLGVAENKILAVSRDGDPALNARERAAVRFAQAMTFDASAVPQAAQTGLVEQFTPQERVEIAIVATAMGILNKCNDALGVPLESEFEDLVR